MNRIMILIDLIGVIIFFILSVLCIVKAIDSDAVLTYLICSVVLNFVWLGLLYNLFQN